MLDAFSMADKPPSMSEGIEDASCAMAAGEWVHASRAPLKQGAAAGVCRRSALRACGRHDGAHARERQSARSHSRNHLAAPPSTQAGAGHGLCDHTPSRTKKREEKGKRDDDEGDPHTGRTAASYFLLEATRAPYLGGARITAGADNNGIHQCTPVQLWHAVMMWDGVSATSPAVCRGSARFALWSSAVYPGWKRSALHCSDKP